MEANILGNAPNKQDMFNKINRGYDKWVSNHFISSYYQKSMYMNWGYWNDKTHTVKDACDNLVDTLMSFIQDKHGNILEVACGAGGVTKRLCNYYDPSDISAINISKFQLQEAAKNAPGCHFMLMDATELKFQDNAFDNIISVEAAFHFNTRAKFFDEAYRILKPGGKLVMSDILFSSSFSSHIAKRLKKWFFINEGRTVSGRSQATANIEYREKEFVSLEEYRQLFIDAGFKDIVILDITKATFNKFVVGMIKSIPKFNKGAIAKKIGAFLYCLGFFGYFKIIAPIDNYLLISATK